MRLRGAYFAKRCPERVQLDVLRPCEPLPEAKLPDTVLFVKVIEFEAAFIAPPDATSPFV